MAARIVLKCGKEILNTRVKSEDLAKQAVNKCSDLWLVFADDEKGTNATVIRWSEIAAIIHVSEQEG